MKKNDVVIVRTVTHYYVGKVLSVTTDEVQLDEASWIADTGRWHEALKTGVLNEVEPFVDPVTIKQGAIVDYTYWRHALPKDVK